MLEDDERANEQASLGVLEIPTQIIAGSELARMLASQQTQFILPDEYACYNKGDKGPRFLATKGVFTCIAVFACDASGRGFAAHIQVPRLHVNFWKKRGMPLLPELTNALKWTFKKADPHDVKVYLVGGQKAQDIDVALCSFFPGQKQKHSIAWHVKDAVLSAGLLLSTPQSTRLLNVFPGRQMLLCFVCDFFLTDDSQAFPFIFCSNKSSVSNATRSAWLPWIE